MADYNDIVINDMTPEIFEQKYKPLVHQVLGALQDSPNLPEDLDLAQAAIGLTHMTDTLEMALKDSIEVVKQHREQHEKDESTIKRLRDYNTGLVVQVSKNNERLQGAKAAAADEKPELPGWDKINAMYGNKFMRRA